MSGFLLFQASLRGGVLILAVLTLRILLRRLPKRGLCLLWTAVWLRLAFPFALRSRFSLLPSWLLLSPNGSEQADAQGLLIHPTAASAFFLPASLGYLDVPLLVWAVGLSILLLAALVRYGWLKRRVREAIPLRGRIWLCDWVESPFLLGLFRPRIYLPSGVEETDIPWIAAHEEAHLRHGDPWRQLAAFLLTAAYWFQPLVWVAFFLYRRDLELACDERASRNFDDAARNGYIQALLRASVPKRSVWTAPLAFGAAPLRKRIRALRQPPHCGRGAVVAAALLSAVLLLACTLEPARAADTAPKEPSDRSEFSFVISDASDDASILTHSDGEYAVLEGEAYVMLYDQRSGEPFALMGPVSRKGEAP